MFEEYLEDSYYFAKLAFTTHDDREAKRYYRVSIFCAMGALEAFINYMSDIIEQGETLEPYEIAFLADKQFTLIKGEFQIADKREYHKIEDKMRLLIQKFVRNFDFKSTLCWSQLLQFKKFRDSITHPREDEDVVSVVTYKRMIRLGLRSVIEIMNYVCRGVIKKPLRKRIQDLARL